MAEDVLAYLHSKGVETKQATGPNVHTACWYCGESPGKRGRLYINVDPNAEPPGLFTCFLCGRRGGLNAIKKHFGDPITDSKVERFSEVHRVRQAAAVYYHANLAEHPEIVQYLQTDRGLTEETIKKHQLGYADGGLLEFLLEKKYDLDDIKGTALVQERNGKLVDFLDDAITIPYIASGSVVNIRGRKMSGETKYLTPPKSTTRLFNTDALFQADQIVVTEGEFDALLLEQMGYAAVGCPGANVWQDSFTQYTASAKRVYIVFDNDSSGRAGLEKIQEQIGHRARGTTVPPLHGPEDHNDISDWILQQGHTQQDFENLLARTSGGLLLTVDDAIREFSELQGREGIKFGHELLDVMIKPGLLPSQVMVILAKTGTGKTLHLLNTFQSMAMEKPDIKILFCSLEQTRGDWFERARRIHGFHNLDLAPDFEKPGDQFYERLHGATLDFWRNNLLMVDKNRMTEEDLVSCIEEYEEYMGARPDVVAIDYLGYWASSFKGKDKYEKVTDAVMALKAVAKEYQVPIIAPHQVNRGADFGSEFQADSARDSGAVEETGDFVFGLWSPDSQKGKKTEERTGRVHLKILKSRHGGKGTEIEYQFAPLTLAMVPITSMAHREARHELEYQLRKDSWEQALWRHKTGMRTSP